MKPLLLISSYRVSAEKKRLICFLLRGAELMSPLEKQTGKIIFLRLPFPQSASHFQAYRSILSALSFRSLSKVRITHFYLAFDKQRCH